MKKIFALLLSVGSLTSVIAQSNRDYDSRNPAIESEKNDPREYTPNGYKNGDNVGYASNDRRFDKSYSHGGREMNYRIERINREYDYKVSSVLRNRFLSSREKNRILRNLERERWERIREVNGRYRDKRYDDHYDHRTGRY